MNTTENALSRRISFVVITLDADRSFWDTIISIESEITSLDEIVIVAPESTCKQLRPEINQVTFSTCLVTDRHEGIYPAQNLGVQHAKYAWLCIVNSGDRILSSCRERFIKSIEAYPSAEVHCFAQQVIDNTGKILYTSYPRQGHFLSHQSIVYGRSLHSRYGLYDTSFLYCADQLFFASLYGKVEFAFSDTVTSVYQLGGFSDTFSLRLANESYKVRKLYTVNILGVVIRSYILPSIRSLADKVVPGTSTALRCMFNRTKR
jgi:hypothetical protein